MLHTLAKFHYQTVFTSQFIPWNVFRVSFLDIWWRHNIWISENWKFDYLKNKKSSRSEIKTFFLVSLVLCFRYTKQISKNVVDTTFNDFEKSEWEYFLSDQ